MPILSNFPSGAGVAGSYYGTSATGAATANKYVTCAGFELKAGAIVSVKFSNANTLSNAINLNVGGTGALPIYLNGAATSSSNPLLWSGNRIITFIYSGSNWNVIAQNTNEAVITQPAALDNSFTITSGGYYIDGIRCYVQMRINLTSSLAAGSSVYISEDMPGTITNATPITSIVGGNVQTTSINARVLASGRLQIINTGSAAISTSTNIDLNGVYTIA